MAYRTKTLSAFQSFTYCNLLTAILPRDAMLVRYMLSSCVRLFVRHTPVFYENR